MGSSRGADPGRLAALTLLSAVLFACAPFLVIPGYLLHYDSVAVPNQAILPWMWGAGTAPPRSVPQDAIVAVLDNVVPGWILQRLMIVSALLLLGFGVARLLRSGTSLEKSCAAVIAMWSTYVFERMAMGHWGLLLAVAALPWVIDSSVRVRDGERGAGAKAVAWVALGSLVPSGGVLQVLAVLLVMAWPGTRDLRRSLGVLVAAILLQLVWIVPGALHPGGSFEDAAEAFGLRAEGSAGPILTAVTTGGIWNSGAMPDSREGWMSILAALVLLAAAGAGLIGVRRLRPSVVGPLAALAVLGFAWALLTTVPAFSGFVLRIESVPGGGLLRDAHKWLAPWLILLAMAAGSGLARFARLFARTDARGPATVLVLLVPVVLLPDLAFGMGGRLQPVRYPGEWEAVRSHLVESDNPGDVVSWPWSTFRAYEWNSMRTSLDPAPRYLPRTVVTDSRLLVQQGDRLVTVPSDDPRSAAVGEALLAEDAADRLARLGIGWILIQKGQPATPGFPVALPSVLKSESTPVVRAGSLELRRLSTAPTPQVQEHPMVIAGAWLVWSLVLFAICLSLVRTHLVWGPWRPRLGRDPSANLPGTERR